VEIHRNDRSSRKLGLVGIVYGLVSGLVGGVFALLAGHPGLLSVILWGSGGFFLLIGLYATLNQLVLWLAPGATAGGRPKFRAAGRRGYLLAGLSELVETPDEVMAILQRYAGSSFRSVTSA
jgi:hypothetical protein